VTAFEDAVAKLRAGGDATQLAGELVAQLDLDEKLGCLDGDTPFWPGTVDLGNGGYYEHAWPAAKVERLGIPGLDFADGPRGCVVGASTAFPVSMARGASFDPDLERRIGSAIGEELRASGATYTGAVCMNLLRHPAWGRAQETYGEDPHHVGEMAAALTQGLQQHVMACMKHFAVNSMENARFQVDVVASERALHEVYLPHFKRVAQAGVASVMSSYNSLNGQWCGENADLLTQTLREDWGWDGFVITDFVFGLRDPVKSVTAGCNVEMPFRQQRAVALANAVAAGELSERQIDARVTETLATFLRFAHVYEGRPERGRVACAEHRALARDAATASMVLLRNESSLLPLAAESLRKLAVVGRLAAVPNLGDGGSSNVLQPDVVTPLAGLQSALPGCEVVHSDTGAGVADSADLAVVVVGYTAEDEGEYIHPDTSAKLVGLFPPPDHPLTGFPENYQSPTPAAQADGGDAEAKRFSFGGDRSSLRLSDADEALIRAVAARNQRVVVAVMAGSAVVMPWLSEVPAALMLWYPGMEGGHALADVLLGRAEPGGRLPFAVPTDESQLVDFDPDATRQEYGLLHGQWWLDANGTAPHLPFGHGLGYTHFELGHATAADDHVLVEVRNTGARAGKTVVQVYGSVPDSQHERPARRLVGFCSAQLAAGETTSLRIPVDLACLDLRVDGRWLREPLPVVLRVGFDAASAAPIDSA
jgi:beta-glucosidase